MVSAVRSALPLSNDDLLQKLIRDPQTHSVVRDALNGVVAPPIHIPGIEDELVVRSVFSLMPAVCMHADWSAQMSVHARPLRRTRRANVPTCQKQQPCNHCTYCCGMCIRASAASVLQRVLRSCKKPGVASALHD